MKFRTCAIWLLVSLGVLPTAQAQQWRASDARQRGIVAPPPDIPSQEAFDDAERRARMREARRMRWLNQMNGSMAGETQDGREVRDGRPRQRMNDMSHEDRARLRSDIREAGHSAYGGDDRLGRRDDR